MSAVVQYAIAIFTGAFLLFLVQPLIGKYVLPWFGGGAGVWSACLLFFQVMLLAGYAYAHAINRFLSPRAQAVVHVVVMLAALGFLPIIPNGEVWKPRSDDAEPALKIVVLLLVCLGGPYLALSATGPLLQAWFARSFPNQSPYRLYALSNLGSLVALLSYPFVIEPQLARREQALIWSGGFVFYVLVCGACAIQVWRRPVAAGDVRGNRIEAAAARVKPWPRTMWVVLPMIGSILLMSFTARLSEQVAPVPLLWVAPLAVYLITFIIAFEYPKFYHRAFAMAGLLTAYALIGVFYWFVQIPILGQVVGHLVALFLCCMVCHGETYRLRPPVSGLTGYYLCIAAGGALGGAFVALAAPRLFTINLEFYLGLFGTFVALMACVLSDRTSWYFSQVPGRRRISVGGTVLASMLTLASGAALLWVNHNLDPNTVVRMRNFYGTLSIGAPEGTEDHPPVHVLRHGRIIHGIQFIAPDPRWLRLPTSYYGLNSGTGIVLRNWPSQGPRRVGLVGMGIGTLATYGRRGDVFRFYEINPQVVDIARSDWFAFVKGSPAEVQVALGDARLVLEREDPQRFDILVLDAFSGDAIPVHLLTTEAFAVYKKHLNPDGAILVNVTNSYLRLDLVMARAAMELGWESRRFLCAADNPNMVTESMWVLLTQNRELLEQPEVKSTGVAPNPNIRRVRLWTDDHTSVFQILQ